MDQFQLPGGVATDLLDGPWPRFFSLSHEKNHSCHSLLPKANGRTAPNRIRRGRDKRKSDAGTYNLCFGLGSVQGWDGVGGFRDAQCQGLTSPLRGLT